MVNARSTPQSRPKRDGLRMVQTKGYHHTYTRSVNLLTEPVLACEKVLKKYLGPRKINLTISTQIPVTRKDHFFRQLLRDWRTLLPGCTTRCIPCKKTNKCELSWNAALIIIYRSSPLLHHSIGWHFLLATSIFVHSKYSSLLLTSPNA